MFFNELRAKAVDSLWIKQRQVNLFFSCLDWLKTTSSGADHTVKTWLSLMFSIS